jgi:hypothetical protein
LSLNFLTILLSARLITNFVSSRRFNLYPRSNVIIAREKKRFFSLVIIDVSYSFRWLREEASFLHNTKYTHPLSLSTTREWKLICLFRRKTVSIITQFSRQVKKQRATVCVGADCNNKSRSRLLFYDLSQSECVTTKYLSFALSSLGFWDVRKPIT